MTEPWELVTTYQYADSSKGVAWPDLEEAQDAADGGPIYRRVLLTGGWELMEPSMNEQSISNAEAVRLYDQRMEQLRQSAPPALAEDEVAILRMPMPVRGIVAVTQALQLAYGDDLDILTLHDHGPDVMVIARGAQL